ncbi:MAG: carboxylating nicotinate-nucleotide diphosphorylase [Solirubrobacteraceae bacterium]
MTGTMIEATTRDLVARALAEDLGAGDLTSAATIPESARARATITQKEPGVLFGLDAAERTFRALDPEVAIERLVAEGEWREGGPLLSVEGTARGLLGAERTALNFLARLSGVATLAARCVGAIEGTGAKILDTRKTTPGLRALEKAAVAAGGAINHRAGLFDAILIKENHATIAGGVGEAVRRARAYAPGVPLEVECRTLIEVDAALAALGEGTLTEVDEELVALDETAAAPQILLDNMTPEGLRAAVRHVSGRVLLEASGGVTLETLREVASTGVQFVSVGALTHSAPALDLSLILQSPP